MRASWRLAVAVSSVVLLAAAAPALAGVAYNWNSPVDASWASAANWSPSTDYPRLADDSAAVPGGLGQLRLDGAYSIGAMTVEAGGSVLLNGTLTLEQSAGLSNAGLLVANTSTSTLYGAIVQGAAGSIEILSGATLSIRKAPAVGLQVANGGTITVNSNQGASLATLRFDESAALSGTGRIVLNHSTTASALAKLDTGTGYTLTQLAGHTISGQGEVSAQLTNGGLVSADVAGKELKITTTAKTKTNLGTMQAIDGGILRIDQVTLTQNASGIIRADGPTSKVVLNGTSIKNGRLATANGGTITATGTQFVSWENIANEGSLNTNGGTTITLLGASLVNDGIITVHADDVGGVAKLAVGANLNLGGSGRVVLRRTDAELSTSIGNTLTQAVTHTISGQGALSAKLNNLGTVEAVGGTLTVSGTVTQFSGSTLTGGTWVARPGATLNLSTASNFTVNKGAVVLDGIGSQIAKINGLSDNQGRFGVLGGRKFTTVAALLNSGTIEVGGSGSELKVTGALTGAGSTVVDQGASLTASFIVQGTLSIGANSSVTIAPAGAASAAAVPEPSTFALLAVGGAALVGCAWRRGRRGERQRASPG